MTEPTPEKSEKELKRQSYTNAMSRLRDAHLDEFNSLRTEEAKKLGLDWKPKPTAEQKAQQELEALLTAHPNLLDKIVQSIRQTTPSVD